MKIVYIHQYFRTPDEPGGTRSYWISRELVKRGHQVVMITSTNKIHPKKAIEFVDGIEIHYIENEYDNYMSKFKKIKSFLNFMYKSTNEASKQTNVDLVFATSTPLTVGGVAIWLNWVKKFPYIFEVRDLWPEFPIQIGAIKNKFLIKILKTFEKKIYNNSKHVIALSPGMREGVISTGTPIEKVSMIPNMAKPDKFYPHAINNDIAKKFSINPEKFNIIHFGSMGLANGLQYIIETARLCKEQNISDVNFIFLGNGATLPSLKNLSEKYNLDNVQFLGNHNMKTVSEIVNICDLSITSFKNIPILYTNSPNKLFDSLSAGKPIVVNSAGWTKELVEKENCGFYVNPENPQDFVNKIIKCKDNRNLLSKWGENARNLSLTKFDKNILTSQIADIIEKVNKQ